MKPQTDKHFHTMPLNEWKSIERHIEKNTISIAERERLEVILKGFREMDDRFNKMVQIDELYAKDFPENELERLFDWESWAAKVGGYEYPGIGFGPFERYVHTNDPVIKKVVQSYKEGLHHIKELERTYTEYKNNYDQELSKERRKIGARKREIERDLEAKSKHLNFRFRLHLGIISVVAGVLVYLLT